MRSLSVESSVFRERSHKVCGFPIAPAKSGDLRGAPKDESLFEMLLELAIGDQISISRAVEVLAPDVSLPSTRPLWAPG